MGDEQVARAQSQLAPRPAHGACSGSSLCSRRTGTAVIPRIVEHRLAAATGFQLVLACLLVLSANALADEVRLPDFTGLVETQGAAVVNISTRQVRKAPSRLPFQIPELDESDPMFDLFRKFIPRAPEAPGADPENQSLGSGFIISADG
ncbi:hypothetical protein RZS08_16115, partial [Arthrospira platensis SPKY1]|nr:hypothetical protein [Arthrospira platensis SPKY1]